MRGFRIALHATVSREALAASLSGAVWLAMWEAARG